MYIYGAYIYAICAYIAQHAICIYIYVCMACVCAVLRKICWLLFSSLASLACYYYYLSRSTRADLRCQAGRCVVPSSSALYMASDAHEQFLALKVLNKQLVAPAATIERIENTFEHVESPRIDIKQYSLLFKSIQRIPNSLY